MFNIERVKFSQSVMLHMLCYSAHSPLGLFSGRLHQVLRLLLAIFTTIEILLPYLCLS